MPTASEVPSPSRSLASLSYNTDLLGQIVKDNLSEMRLRLYATDSSLSARWSAIHRPRLRRCPRAARCSRNPDAISLPYILPVSTPAQLKSSSCCRYKRHASESMQLHRYLATYVVCRPCNEFVSAKASHIDVSGHSLLSPIHFRSQQQPFGFGSETSTAMQLIKILHSHTFAQNELTICNRFIDIISQVISKGSRGLRGDSFCMKDRSLQPKRYEFWPSRMQIRFGLANVYSSSSIFRVARCASTKPNRNTWF